jgi:hypothetical protein
MPFIEASAIDHKSIRNPLDFILRQGTKLRGYIDEHGDKRFALWLEARCRHRRQGEITLTRMEQGGSQKQRMASGS